MQHIGRYSVSIRYLEIGNASLLMSVLLQIHYENESIREYKNISITVTTLLSVPDSR